MAETGDQATAAVGFKGHSTVIDEIGLGDRTVTAAVGQLERYRRSGPLSGRDVGDIAFFIPGLIMPPKVVRPDRRTGGDDESGVFIRYA